LPTFSVSFIFAIFLGQIVPTGFGVPAFDQLPVWIERSNELRGGEDKGRKIFSFRLAQKTIKLMNNSIFVQSFLICGFLEVQNLAFDFVPIISSSLQGDWTFVATFAENWVIIRKYNSI
jgi:hypothetical protein